MNLICILVLFLLPLLASSSEKKVYIVYFGGHEGTKTLQEIEERHHSYLASVKETEEEARDSLIYSYKHSINGFAAVLTPDEASKLSEKEEVVSVFESHPREYSPQTTRSWEFLGLEALEEVHSRNQFSPGRDLVSRAKYGKDIIIGLIDSGIWPESESFNDKGMGPIPKSWKGFCETGPDFNSSHCNRKIIGARYYVKAFEVYNGPLNTTEDTLSPRDLDGHGTHTASIATGRRVKNASFLGGIARGTATGGAPMARLAVYKVCWAKPNKPKVDGNTCLGADILAGIDDAIGDGVHIMSISIGTSSPSTPYDGDGIAIGALHAVRQEIVVVAAAGNSGPKPGSLSNVAPWIITVGASTLDRAFHGPLTLGNGVHLVGQTVTPYLLHKMYPLVYAGDVEKSGLSKNATGQCLNGSLSPKKVEGKIVLCYRGQGYRVEKSAEVKRAGGVGFVLGNLPMNGLVVPSDAFFLPATALNPSDALKVFNYIKSAKKPMATIGATQTVLNIRPAPLMANFTSRGPSTIDPFILKPDITAPGVDILAAWSEGISLSKLTSDPRRVKYNFDSGTSMATPHVSGTAALLKAIHPRWSSSAIRSALMTTAWTKDNVGSRITDYDGAVATPFAFGSGHFRPTKAVDPGLVYEASYTDYLTYLCNGRTNFRLIDPTFKCPGVFTPSYNLNYPSLALHKINGSVIVSRTVTNVGNPSSVYSFTAKPPLGISVKAAPSILVFDRVGQKESFTMTVTPSDSAKSHYKDDYAFGWYTWTDSYHYVRSPIAVSLA